MTNDLNFFSDCTSEADPFPLFYLKNNYLKMFKRGLAQYTTLGFTLW